MTAGIGVGTTLGCPGGRGTAGAAATGCRLGRDGAGAGSAAAVGGRFRFEWQRQAVRCPGGGGAAAAGGSTGSASTGAGAAGAEMWPVARAPPRGAASPASPLRTARIHRRALVGRQGRDRRLPLEGVEPAGDRRDRPPAVADIAVGGPGRIVQRAHRAQGPCPGAAPVAMFGALDLRHQQRDALGRCCRSTAPAPRAPWQIRRRRSRRARSRARLRYDRALSPPASRPAPAAAARNRRVSHAHRRRPDPDAAAPATPSRRCASNAASDAPRSRICWQAPRPAPGSAPA